MLKAVGIFIAMAGIWQGNEIMAFEKVPIETDYAIFLFDNGDKNMIASMLNYAEGHDRIVLQNLDFRIIFMGASVDAMGKPPFCHYPEKLIHYKQLGVEETIDHFWQRDRKLPQVSLDLLLHRFAARKKVWTGVSCTIFRQILQFYEKNSSIETSAFRDNLWWKGESDYFRVAEEVQQAASNVIVPSEMSGKGSLSKQLIVVGHGPLEEWLSEAELLDQMEIINRLGLDPMLPIVAFSGSYGDYYQEAFEKFIAVVPDVDIQIVIAPHPRFKGTVEEKVIRNLSWENASFFQVGEWECNPSKKARAVEVLTVADIVVTGDATSTIVFQANALGKKVFTIGKSSHELCTIRLLRNIEGPHQFMEIIQEIASSKGRLSETCGSDIFRLLGMPRDGAARLWQELIQRT